MLKRFVSDMPQGIWDITPPLSAGTPVFPGDEPFSMRRTQSLSDPSSANVSAATLSLHCGAHADAPLHLFDSGADAAALPLSALVGPALVIDLSTEETSAPVGREVLDAYADLPSRVLLRTRRTCPHVWSNDYRAVSEDFFRALADRGGVLFGTDAPSIDPVESCDLPAHKVALGRGLVVLENLDLSRVKEGIYELIALPLPIVGGDAAPLRAVLRTVSEQPQMHLQRN